MTEDTKETGDEKLGLLTKLLLLPVLLLTQLAGLILYLAITLLPPAVLIALVWMLVS